MNLTTLMFSNTFINVFVFLKCTFTLVKTHLEVIFISNLILIEYTYDVVLAVIKLIVTWLGHITHFKMVLECLE